MTATHHVKAVRGDRIPGTWVGVCACGWRGHLLGAKGARQAALTAAYSHEFDASREEVDA